jgi:hypothetical protein
VDFSADTCRPRALDVSTLSKVLARGTYVMTVGEICKREVVMTDLAKLVAKEQKRERQERVAR